MHRSAYEVCNILVGLELNVNFLDRLFKKYSNTKFHDIPSSGSRVLTRGRTDITKLIVTFHTIANKTKTRKPLTDSDCVRNDTSHDLPTTTIKV